MIWNLTMCGISGIIDKNNRAVDRSDIKALSTSLDDAIDQMNKTGKTALLYDVTEFQPNMRAMADGVIALAGIVAEALPLMRNIAANSARRFNSSANR